MTTVVGVDGAMAATGLAVWRNTRAYLDTIVTDTNTPKVKRWQQIVHRVWSQVFGPTVIAVEALPTGIQGPSKMYTERAGLLALIEEGCDTRQIPFVEIHPTTLKVYACGKGNASKLEVIAAAVKDGADPRTEHEAFAYWLAAMAIDHYQYNRSLRPAGRQVEALGHVRWPQWTWPTEQPTPTGR